VGQLTTKKLKGLLIHARQTKTGTDAVIEKIKRAVTTTAQGANSAGLELHFPRGQNGNTDKRPGKKFFWLKAGNRGREADFVPSGIIRH
jgi:hypothetical protein